jgi:light-regulated signal transduction histidine kinase (bacteriophytochrome)
MDELIDDLLRFSRMGRKSFNPEPVALYDVLKSAVDTLSDQIRATSAQVVTPAQMPVVLGDLALSTHVFINLIENAIKYQKKNEAPIVDIGIEIEDQHVVISVADNGIGIAPEYHEKIFNIFQRLHNQSEYPGTGIGLAAVKKAVQMMSGQIWVESELGKGSIFKIEIPVATPK